MSEWWTYTLADFLMFSSRTYWRTVALYNEALWPWHVAAIAAGAVIVGCALRRTARARRIGMLLLAAAWAWVAWGWHLECYADISTAAPWFAGAFVLQALMLCILAFKREDACSNQPAYRAGLIIIMISLFIYPLLAPVAGEQWNHAEAFGMTPEPTVLMTLGVLLISRFHWSAWVIPLAWCMVSAATMAELHISHAWILPAVGVSSIALKIYLYRVN